MLRSVLGSPFCLSTGTASSGCWLQRNALSPLGMSVANFSGAMMMTLIWPVFAFARTEHGFRLLRVIATEVLSP